MRPIIICTHNFREPTECRIVSINYYADIIYCRDPVLDAKYFQKTGSFDDTPHLPRTGRTSPTPIHFSSSPNGQTINSTRLNKDSIVPNIMAAKPTQGRVPLSSAYFPSNPTKVT